MKKRSSAVGFSASRRLMLTILGLTLGACSSLEMGSRDSQINLANQIARQSLEKQRRYEAELRAEANGASLDHADYQRLLTALRLKRERAQIAQIARANQANWAEFQRRQRLGTAQPDSSNLIATSGEIPSDYRQIEYGNGSASRSLTRGQSAPDRNLIARSLVQRLSGRNYADSIRTYQRDETQDDSAAQASPIRNPIPADTEAPYAIPVPGRPGYVTMPPKLGGYIDVRGYAPGSLVMDPWTKTIIRVP